MADHKIVYLSGCDLVDAGLGGSAGEAECRAIFDAVSDDADGKPAVDIRLEIKTENGWIEALPEIKSPDEAMQFLVRVQTAAHAVDPTLRAWGSAHGVLL